MQNLHLCCGQCSFHNDSPSLPEVRQQKLSDNVQIAQLLSHFWLTKYAKVVLHATDYNASLFKKASHPLLNGPLKKKKSVHKWRAHPLLQAPLHRCGRACNVTHNHLTNWTYIWVTSISPCLAVNHCVITGFASLIHCDRDNLWTSQWRCSYISFVTVAVIYNHVWWSTWPLQCSYRACMLNTATLTVTGS